MRIVFIGGREPCGAFVADAFDFGDEFSRPLLQKVFRSVAAQKLRELFLRFEGQFAILSARAQNLNRLRLERLRAVKGENLRVEDEQFRSSVEPRFHAERADRDETSAFKFFEKRAFRQNGEPRRFVEKLCNLCVCFVVVFARFKSERALSDGRQKIRAFESRRRARGESETFQSRVRENERVEFARVELFKARFNVAADILNVPERFVRTKLRAISQRHALATHATCAKLRAGRKLVERLEVVGDKDVARILARRRGGEFKTGNAFDGQILEAVRRDVDFSGKERGLNLFGENALRAEISDRFVSFDVPRGRDLATWPARWDAFLNVLVSLRIPQIRRCELKASEKDGPFVGV